MIKALSAFWMFAIVLFHADGGAQPIWYRELMSDCRMAGVGFFFVISGYFLMKRYEPTNALQWWLCAIAKRVKSLLLPYFIWCLIAMLLRFPHEHHIQPLCLALGITNVFPTINPPLWYIKFLFLFVLLSLPISYAIKRSISLVIVVGLLLLIPLVALPLKFSFFFSITLFAVGVFLALHKRILACIGYYRHWIGGVSIVLWIMIFLIRLRFSDNLPLRMYSADFAIVSSWYLFKVIDQHFSMAHVNIPTFFIFCTHSIILSFIPSSRFVVQSVERGILAFVISVICAVALKRICPRIYGFLTVNR